MGTDRLNEFSDKVLQMARSQAEQAEVFTVRNLYVPVSFEANKLKRIETKETQGLSLRVVANGRIGLASTTRLDDPARLVADALAVAEFGAQAKFDLPDKVVPTDVPIYDQAVTGWPVEDMVSLGKGLIEQLLDFNPEVLVDFHLAKATSEIGLVNSRGGGCTYRKTDVSLEARANLIRGADMLDVYEESASGQMALQADQLVARLTEKIRLAERTVPPGLGQVPVIFTPKGVVGTLLLALQSALNGKIVLQGASPLSQKLGEKVFDNRFTLYDDGQVPYATTSAPCDDEGVPSRRTPLIEAGIVSSFYYDLQTAGLAGKASTGNGSRGLGSLPTPGPRAWLISEGDRSLEAICKEIGRGLVVDQTMGAWSGNVIGGEFSGNVHLGYQVEGGEIVGRVKDTMVSGNVFQALDNLIALGDRAEWLHGAIKVPHLCVASLGVASKG